MSNEQIEILLARKAKLDTTQLSEGENLLPDQIEILNKAIELSKNKSTDPTVIRNLEKIATDMDQGIYRYQHNIGRGGFLTKLTSGEVIDGKLTYFEFMDRILKSGSLLPFEGTYIKGTYLQGTDLTRDNQENSFKFALGEETKNMGS